MPCKNPSQRSRGRWRRPPFNHVLFITGAAALLACALMSSCGYPHKKQPVVPRPLLEHVKPQDVPELSDTNGDKASLKRSVEESLAALSRLDANQKIPFGDKTVTVSRLRDTLQAFLQLLCEGLSNQAFHEELIKRFDFYRANTVHSDDNEKKTMLITGYFEPEIPASLSPDSRFVYPIYGVPSDLISFNPKDFDPNLPNMTIWGRVSGHRLIPYYTRDEIDYGEGSKGASPLAWIESPVDGLMLHIQGSGILRFRGGRRRFIHYAASNGLPYKSVGRWLIEYGFLSEDQADWGHIRSWAAKNPERLKDALASNPRYIFFKWEEEGPLGSLGEVLIPFRSVALDPAIYPPGAICFLKFDTPPGVVPYMGRSFEGFICNHDTGAAIKGTHRLDLYCGEGDHAGMIAGGLKTPGWFYIILVKTHE